MQLIPTPHNCMTNMHKLPILCIYAHIPKNHCHLEFTKTKVFCQLRDYKIKGEMLKFWR